MNIDRVLSTLDRVKSGGQDKWLACCPAHSDNNPSLSVSVGDSCVLFKCWRGCDGTAVMQSLVNLGCEWNDFFPTVAANASTNKEFKLYYSKAELDELELQAWFLCACINDLNQGKQVARQDLQKAFGCYKSLVSELKSLSKSKHNNVYQMANNAVTMMNVRRLAA